MTNKPSDGRDVRIKQNYWRKVLIINVINRFIDNSIYVSNG